MIVELNGLIGGIKTNFSIINLKYQDALRQTIIITVKASSQNNK